MFHLLNKDNFDFMISAIWEKVKAAVPTKMSQLEDDADCGMKGATAETDGASGMVPQPGAGKQNAFLRGDGTWVTPSTNLLGTVPGIPLDNTMGKALKDDIDKNAEDISALDSNLSELSNKLTYTTVNVVASEYIAASQLHIAKYGNICILYGYAQFTGVVGVSKVIFGIPDGYKPKFDFQFMLSKQTSASIQQYCGSNSDGNVVTWQNNAVLDADHWFLSSPVVYICK